jgi:hypothetical protein
VEESKSGGGDLERELETLRRRLQQAEALAVSTQAQLDSVVATQREEAAAQAATRGGRRGAAAAGSSSSASTTGVKLGAFEAEHVTASALASGGTTEAVPETEEDIARRRRREWIMSGRKGAGPATGATDTGGTSTQPTLAPAAQAATSSAAANAGVGSGASGVTASATGRLAGGPAAGLSQAQAATAGTSHGPTGGSGNPQVAGGPQAVASGVFVPSDATASAATSSMVQVPMDVLSQTLAAAVSAGAAQAHQAQWQAQAQAAAASAGDYYSSGYGYYGTEYQYPDGAAGVVGAYDPSAAAAWGAASADHQSPHAAVSSGTDGTGDWSRLYDEQSGYVHVVHVGNLGTNLLACFWQQVVP